MEQTCNTLEIRNGKVLNPITSRWVSIGSSTYNKLVRDNILDVSKYEVNKVIYSGVDAKKVMKNLKVDVGKNKTLYVKNDEIRMRNKRVKKQEIRKRSKELALEVYKDNPDLFVGLSIPEVKSLLENLVSQKLVSGTYSNPRIQSSWKYIVENIDSESSSDEEDEGDFYTDDEDEFMESQGMAESVSLPVIEEEEEQKDEEPELTELEKIEAKIRELEGSLSEDGHQDTETL